MTRAVELSSTALVSMWQYYALLRQREDKPVMPIALVFYPGREGIAYEGYEETLFGHTILTFHYLQISLPLLRAEDYARGQNLLGVGLASVMRLPRSRKGRIDLYLACLRRLIDAELAGTIDPARTFLLSNIVETYSPLSDAERDQLRVQLQEEGDTIYDNRTRIPTVSPGAVGRDCPPYAAHDRGRLAVPAR